MQLRHSLANVFEEGGASVFTGEGIQQLVDAEAPHLGTKPTMTIHMTVINVMRKMKRDLLSAKYNF